MKEFICIKHLGETVSRSWVKQREALHDLLGISISVATNGEVFTLILRTPEDGVIHQQPLQSETPEAVYAAMEQLAAERLADAGYSIFSRTVL